MNACNPRTWSNVIRNYSLAAKHEQVISLFLQKVNWPFGFTPDDTILADVFKASAALLALNLGKSLHTFSIKLGHLSCLSVSKGLLNFYAKSRAFDECENLFCQIRNPDAVVWNIVLSGLSGSRKHDFKVLSLFYSMHYRNDPNPNPVTIAIVLPVCARLADLKAGKTIHSYTVKTGIESNTLVGNALTSMYAKSGLVHSDAYGAFSEIREKDIISWNAIIAGFSENGFKRDAYMLFRDMLQWSIKPNYATLASILRVCATMDLEAAHLLARELHAYILKNPEFEQNTSVINALLSFYLRIGLSKEAESLFHGMESRDLVSWNAVIAGYALNKNWLKALQLFRELITVHDLQLDSVTLISVLPACTTLRFLQLGKQIHGYVIHRPELHDSVAVSNALISFYSNCMDVSSSYYTFLMSSERDLISFNAMLDTFAVHGYNTEVEALLHQMLEEEFGPDVITLILLIRFYGSRSNLLKLTELHGFLLRTCILHRVDDSTLLTALLIAYGKCANLDYAFRIFSMTRKDVMSWNSMIHVFAENNRPDESFHLLHQFQEREFKPDAATLMSILPVCSRTASIDFLKQCQAYAVRAGFKDARLNGALIDIYAKCGAISSARTLFQSSDKDVVMYTAMINGYAINGMGEHALNIYIEMIKTGMKPDKVTITAVLSACSHAGFLDEGLMIFDSMEKVYGIKPSKEQYACIADLLGRGGRVRDAYEFVKEMPMEAGAKIWSSLLSACIGYNEMDLGRIVGDHLISIDSKDAGSCISVSNLLATDGKWDGVVNVRKAMKSDVVKRQGGCSWVK